MVYTFARVGAVLGMRVEDFYVAGPPRLGAAARERAASVHEMPRHHNLDAVSRGLHRRAPASPTTARRRCSAPPGPAGGELTERPCCRPTSRMIRRRAAAAGIKTEIGCHSFRATGITAYLKNGGKLEIAQQMAAKASRFVAADGQSATIRLNSNDGVKLFEVGWAMF